MRCAVLKHSLEKSLVWWWREGLCHIIEGGGALPVCMTKGHAGFDASE